MLHRSVRVNVILVSDLGYMYSDVLEYFHFMYNVYYTYNDYTYNDLYMLYTLYFYSTTLQMEILHFFTPLHLSNSYSYFADQNSTHKIISLG